MAREGLHALPGERIGSGFTYRSGPGAAFAQQTDQPPEALQARCDLPVVDLFNPMPGDVLQPGDYMISGLALDPMAPADTSGIDRVSFFLGERGNGGVPLGTVVPSSGSRQADFTVTVTLPDNGAGQTQLQAFAHSALTGKETQLGMPIALGDDAAADAPADPSVDVINTNPGVLPDLCSPDDLPLPSVAQSTPNTGAVAPDPTPGAVFASGGRWQAKHQFSGAAVWKHRWQCHHLSGWR